MPKACCCKAFEAPGRYTYGKLESVNACETAAKHRVTVDERYIAETCEVVREQAKRAGVWLVQLLDERSRARRAAPAKR